MSRSAPHPRSRKTPRGGRKMARIILHISLPVKGMSGGRVGERLDGRGCLVDAALTYSLTSS